MKKLLLVFFLFTIVPCTAQDKYLQVTPDSTLAFKLAMSDASLPDTVPSYGRSAGWHLRAAGRNLNGALVASLISSAAFTYAFYAESKRKETDVPFIFGIAFGFASLVMRLTAHTHLSHAGHQLGTE